MQRRSKVGGILDRRFGENDPTMTPEQKALERFVKEKQKADKKGALFDLEDGEEEDQLTHFGQSLAFDKSEHIALKGAHVKSQGSFSPDGGEDLRPVKKRKVSVEISSEDDSFGASFKQHPERPMTKKEVMSEVIAKAKLHKYERQKAKEDDDDLRAELDKGLPDLFAMLRGTSHPSVPAPAHTADPNGFMNPDRAALLNGNEKSQNDRDYDERLRQMVFDQRSKPTERTLTEEEKLHLHAQKLKDLEEKRLRRMKGEHEDSLGEDDEREQDLNVDEDLHADEDDIFGLGSGIPEPMQARDIGVEDEDDFIIEDNLVGSGSELATDDELNENSSASSFDEYDDQEFVQGLLSTDDIGRAGLAPGKTSTDTEPLKGNALAFTYPCPQNHEDLLRITENISLEDLPTVVQRIRALYHPKLHSENKAKLANFSSILVEHVFYLSNLSQHPPFAVLETLIRHIHSLAKTFSDQVGCAFRAHLNTFHKNRPTAPTSGDLVLLTAIASIFPPSDHFHQIVTPANLCMTRYLSQKIPNTLSDLVIGTYLGTLCLQYQNLSKRYIPELVNYVLQALLILAPAKMKAIPGSFPYAASETSLHIEGRLRKSDQVIRRLRFWDSICVSDLSDNSKEELKLALLHGLLALIDNMADLWANKSAFFEAFDPVAKVLEHLTQKPCSEKLPAPTMASIFPTHPNCLLPLLVLTPLPFSTPPDPPHPHPPNPPNPAPLLSSDPSRPNPPQSPSPRDQNLDPQIRRILQPRAPLRPGPRPSGLQQA